MKILILHELIMIVVWISVFSLPAVGSAKYMAESEICTESMLAKHYMIKGIQFRMVVHKCSIVLSSFESLVQ